MKEREAKEGSKKAKFDDLKRKQEIIEKRRKDREEQ